MRTARLPSENAGPRAVLNALDRIADNYAKTREDAERDLALAEKQLQDYENREEVPFIHGQYVEILAETRDKLKDALSSSSPPKEGNATMSELAQQIEQLKAAHTIDAEPRRPQQERVATEEEPITIRARRRIQAVLVPETPDPEPA